MAHSWTVTLLLSTGAVLARSGYFIVTPLWLDFFNTYNHTGGPNSSQTNGSNHDDDDVLGISVCFLMVFQWGFCALAMGLLLLCIRVVKPSAIGPVEKNYPKKQFVYMGFAMGISSVLFNYSVSGSRTPPYIVGILGNFNIPIQFITRFLLLRKRPTFIKLICAVVILLSEFVCLLPTIFPGLESSAAKQDDGGASGVGAFLWPLCMICSMIPFAVSNTLTERTVQSEINKAQIQDGSVQQQHQQATSTVNKINIFYFQFWYFLCVFITAGLSFWVDLLPWFGTSENWQIFSERMQFDIECMAGVHEDCPPVVMALGWANFIKALLAATLLSALMRYSDGANFVVIVLALRTPIVFLWWSLFEEQPFKWSPHAHLSTWLSIGAIAFMLPAVVLYEIGDDLVSKFRVRRALSQERALLVNDTLGSGETYDDQPIY